MQLVSVREMDRGMNGDLRLAANAALGRALFLRRSLVFVGSHGGREESLERIVTMRCGIALSIMNSL